MGNDTRVWPYLQCFHEGSLESSKMSELEGSIGQVR